MKYLWILLDSCLTFKFHILKKSKNAMLNLYKIVKNHSSLTEEACSTLVMGLIIYHLDYNNTVLIGLPKCHINRMQRVQSFAAKVVLNKGKYSSSTEALRSLHWLAFEARIKFKVACWMFNCNRQKAPVHLCNKLCKS